MVLSKAVAEVELIIKLAVVSVVELFGKLTEESGSSSHEK